MHRIFLGSRIGRDSWARRAGSPASAATLAGLAAYLLASLDTIRFALPAQNVVEVLRAVSITRVPGCPSGIEGVVNVRGELVPVYDLRPRFTLAPREVSPEEHLLVVTAGANGRAIVRVSRADELREVDPQALATAERSSDPMVRGLARLPDGLLVVCDLAAFLTDAEAAQTARAIAVHEHTA